MAGVIIFGVRGPEIASARFYLEPLDEGAAGVDDAIRDVDPHMTAAVVDRRPPDAVVRVLNPAMRLALRGVAGRAIGGLAELEFEGRRTARRLRIVVGWHELDDRPLILTPARWRANFEDGRTGHDLAPGPRRAVARDPRRPTPPSWPGCSTGCSASGTSPGSMGLRIADGHQLGADDVVAVGRAAICFRPTLTRLVTTAAEASDRIRTDQVRGAR